MQTDGLDYTTRPHGNFRGAIQVTESSYGSIRSSFLEEAERIMHAARSESVLLRLVGAVAFRMHCPKFAYMQDLLGRALTDIDFASYSNQSSRISRLFAILGYQEDTWVSRLFGAKRLLFHDHQNKRHCDLFLDKMEFCHDIVFRNRLEADEPTVPLAELLLEKMQIVKLTEKDIIDMMMLLREHQIGDSDEETINATRIAYLCANDWGLWKTVTANLERVEAVSLGRQELSPEDKTDLGSKIRNLLTRIHAEPKTARWRLRARIGEKVKWYRDVEELARV